MAKKTTAGNKARAVLRGMFLILSVMSSMIVGLGIIVYFENPENPDFNFNLFFIMLLIMTCSIPALLLSLFLPARGMLLEGYERMVDAEERATEEWKNYVQQREKMIQDFTTVQKQRQREYARKLKGEIYVKLAEVERMHSYEVATEAVRMWVDLLTDEPIKQ